MPNLTYTEKLVTVVCTCGINYAIPEALNEQALRHCGDNGKTIYCPLGHSWVYTGKSDAQKRKEAEAETARLRALLDQEAAARKAEARKAKAALTKMRKRAEATCCPVDGCQRTIDPARMAQHMRAKHPDAS